MNSKFVNFGKKTLSAVAVALALTLAGTSNSFAGTTPDKDKISVNEQLSVNFTGATPKAYAFNIKFENPTGQKFALIIKNEAGEVVYEDTYTDEHFNRNVFLDVEENSINPTFVIQTKDQVVERKVLVSKSDVAKK